MIIIIIQTIVAIVIIIIIINFHLDHDYTLQPYPSSIPQWGGG